MKILVLSDTHGEISAAARLIKTEAPDQVIHLGDCLRDAEDLSNHFPSLPICKVPGNNDWFTDEAKEKAVPMGGARIFLCHGHTTGVKGGLHLQAARALQHNCTVSLFGHTHRPYLEENNGVLLLNPGSLTYSGTYAILTLHPGQMPSAELKNDF